MTSGFSLRPLTAADAPLIAETTGGAAWHPWPQLWATYLEEQRAGARIVRIAWNGGNVVGYGSLLLTSEYERFRNQGIPEINNLVVAEKFRGRGIGSAIIADLEATARRLGCTRIGLGVGLYSDYGPAQRLYVRLGYVPDGHGATYANLPATPGRNYPLDDELLIWLSKLLSSSEPITTAKMAEGRENQEG